jgi:hypothetical protein
MVEQEFDKRVNGIKGPVVRNDLAKIFMEYMQTSNSWVKKYRSILLDRGGSNQTNGGSSDAFVGPQQVSITVDEHNKEVISMFVESLAFR